jgi:hypothetical protein
VFQQGLTALDACWAAAAAAAAALLTPAVAAAAAPPAPPAPAPADAAAVAPLCANPPVMEMKQYLQILQAPGYYTSIINDGKLYRTHICNRQHAGPDETSETVTRNDNNARSLWAIENSGTQEYYLYSKGVVKLKTCQKPTTSI